jgi:hypothetical protein
VTLIGFYKSKKGRSRGILFSILLLNLALLVLTQGTAKSNNAGEKLREILNGTARYCEQLKQAVFHFLCFETIEENIKKSLESDDVPRKTGFYEGYTKLKVYKPKKVKNKYLYEYQIIKEGGRILERRVLIRHNGKKVRIKNPGQKTKLYSYKSSLTPIYFFAKENQDKFDYKQTGSERVMKRHAYVVEVRSKGNKNPTSNEPLAIVWIDRKDYSVLKFKYFSGDFQAERLAGTTKHNVRNIKVKDVHYFGLRKNNLRFPTKTELLVTYNGGPLERDGKPIWLPGGTQWLTKIKTLFFYKKYIFFTVTVGEPIYFNNTPF